MSKENKIKMWIRTVSGWKFFEIKYTSQGFPVIKPKQR